jgi:hypothetical protein
MAEREPKRSTGPREIAWFVGLWAAGVATVTAVGFVIRLFIG